MLAKNVLVPLLTSEANLRRRIRRHLAAVGLTKTNTGDLSLETLDKDSIRQMHRRQRVEGLKNNKEFINALYLRNSKFFANGDDVQPKRIKFGLRLVTANTEDSDLFRLASLTWSVPVSNGFGRRLRYLVWDYGHDKLAGILAIGDPVYNLTVRDKHVGWDTQTKSQNMVNLLDAYVLGAIPPYNLLLGGKAVACMVRSTQVYQDFFEKYGSATGIISKRQNVAKLVAVTTSSALGRSSIYNRLKLDDTEYFTRIGFTAGWGHFHIGAELFLEIRKFLRSINHPYADANRFGNGPNWRLRTIREGLKALGLSESLLRHGIRREVFFCTLADNAIEYLKGEALSPMVSKLKPISEISSLALDRWILPRAERDLRYQSWSKDELFRGIQHKPITLYQANG